MSKILKFALCGFVVLGVFACSDKAPESSAAQKIAAVSDVDVQALLKLRCTACHSVERWEGRSFSAKEWDETLLRMRLKGADYTDEDLKILKHLTR